MVKIALMTTTLNDLKVKSANILNAYGKILVTEKTWTTLGSEFGKNVSMTAVIIRALFGLKSAEAVLENTSPDE